MKSIAVFCGSSSGQSSLYEDQAYLLGKTLTSQDLTLIYGGAKVGLMGAVSNGAIENGGKVIGVLPRFLQRKELAHISLTELILVDTMHQRKKKMDELSDGIIMLPGGFGTLEEFFEMLTWAQLGLHKKPVAILNTNGFYDPLLHMMDQMVEQGFVKNIHRNMVIVDDNIISLLAKMQNYTAPKTGKWIQQHEV